MSKNLLKLKNVSHFLTLSFYSILNAQLGESANKRKIETIEVLETHSFIHKKGQRRHKRASERDSIEIYSRTRKLKTDLMRQ
jgi:predicted glycosyl hydrolase (DUF1957 family)